MYVSLFSSDSDDEESNSEQECYPNHLGNEVPDPDEDPNEDPEDDEEDDPTEILTKDIHNVERAKQGHEPSLYYLQLQYPTFFSGTSSNNEALEQIGDYVVNELATEELFKNSSVNYANTETTKIKRGLDDDSDNEYDEYKNSKRPKLDDNSGSSSGGSNPSGDSSGASGSNPSGSGPSGGGSDPSGGSSSNNRLFHDIMILLLGFFSTIADVISNFLSNIL